MIIAVIPARGGSKRIPRKNLRLFAGKPIMAYSIEAARDARLFDRIVVSTDDEEIAATARAFGAGTPFTRPAELSDDFTGTHAVAAHALTTLIDRADLDDTVACCLYPTAPFVTPDDLRRGFDLLDRSGKSFVFAALPFRSSGRCARCRTAASRRYSRNGSSAAPRTSKPRATTPASSIGDARGRSATGCLHSAAMPPR
jgi:CMP-N-acetylneuraminic acid synthetase